jgi:hypothetical protein
MNIIDQITQNVISKMNEEVNPEFQDGWTSQKRKSYDKKTMDDVKNRKKQLGDIHKSNEKYKNQTAQNNTSPTSNVDFTSKPYKKLVTKESINQGVQLDFGNTKETNKKDSKSKPFKQVVQKEEVDINLNGNTSVTNKKDNTSVPFEKKVKLESRKQEIINQINEIKETIKKITESVPKNIIEEVKYKRFVKKLNEYINIDDYSNGDLGDYVVDEDSSGDEVLDSEIEQIDSNNSSSSNFIDQIRKQALEAMATLADNSQSPEFQTMNNIFVQCQKYANDSKKMSESDKVLPNNSIVK